MQHAIKKAARRNVHLTSDVHDELEAWRELVCSLASRPTHIRELQHSPLTCIGTTDTSGSRMGGVFRDPEGQYFFWRSPFYLATQARLMSSFNPNGDVTINYLDIGALLMQLLLFPPRMAP